MMKIYFMIIPLVLAMNALPLNAEKIRLSKVGGVYRVPILLNDSVKLSFIVDTGASDVVIPWDVFTTLIKSETITKQDILDVQTYQIANGDAINHLVINIRNLKIGSQVLHNVKASVSQNSNIPLLLGQSALQKLNSWQLDTQNGFLKVTSYQKSEPSQLNNIGFTQNQNYVCVNFGTIIGDQFIQTISGEEALAYPLRIKIDQDNILHTDGKTDLKLKYKMKKDNIVVYGNSQKEIHLYVSSKKRFLMLRTAEMPNINLIYNCGETDNWTIIK